MEEIITKGEAKELREKMSAIKDDVAEMLKSAKDRVVCGTTDFAKEHPGASVAVIAAVAAGIGLAVGMMIARNGKD